MSLWNHRLDQNTNENFDSFCPGPFRAEIIKFFVGILVQTKTSKRHFEINWPLTTASMFAWNCYWENWQYALTHKVGPLVPMLNVCTIIGTSTLSIQRESSLLLGTLLIRSKGKKSKVPESIEFIFICEDTGKTYKETG